MSPKPPIPSGSFDLIASQMHPSTPETVIMLIARQLDRANDAKTRIDKEGGVVRDLKGNVIPHPAIAIERAATKTIADLMLKFKKGAAPKRSKRY